MKTYSAFVVQNSLVDIQESEYEYDHESITELSLYMAFLWQAAKDPKSGINPWPSPVWIVFNEQMFRLFVLECENEVDIPEKQIIENLVANFLKPKPVITDLAQSINDVFYA